MKFNLDRLAKRVDGAPWAGFSERGSSMFASFVSQRLIFPLTPSNVEREPKERERRTAATMPRDWVR